MKTFCEYYDAGKCHSCSLLRVDYPQQVRSKEEKLRKLLGHELLPSTSSSQLGFRNKAKMVVSGTIDRPVIGILATETLDCPVHHPTINALLKQMPDFIRSAKLAPYSIEEKKGELKALIVYHSAESKQSYLRMVLRSKEAITRVQKHLTLIKGFTCISANIQPVHQAILEGDEEIILSESSHINHVLGDVKLRLGTKGFVQTNQEVATKLYQTAATWVEEARIDSFVELFCGQGAFSFFCAPFIKKGLGIEINVEAVEEANRTATHLPQLTFKAADAAAVESELRDFHPDLILVNPPRRGLGESIALFKQAPSKHLIYSSCNVETLSADLKALEAVYRIRKVQLFDMFPHTEHFETLVLLEAISS
jgi:23S rRNA (uracil747-C5)-methyltransferase